MLHYTYMNCILPKVNTRSFQSGQTTLLVVLMVMAVSLGIGIAVSQRSNTSIRKSTYTSQTDQAFSCANSAVEKALLCIKDKEDAGLDPTLTSECDGSALSNLQDSGGKDICSLSYTISSLTMPSTDVNQLIFEKIPKDAVQQIDTSTGGSLVLNFKSLQGIDNPSAIEVTEAYLDTTDGTYKMKKWAYGCDNGTGSFPSSDLTGFTMANTLTVNGVDFCHVDLSSSFVTSPESLVRIRTYLDDVTLGVYGDASNNLGFLVNASGTAGTVVRNLEVKRMNPQLPPIFDYVLYSEEGSITK